MITILETMRNFGSTSTSSKVKKATDENEKSTISSSLMKEISVLTYSSQTLREIVQVLKKRLSCVRKNPSHKNTVRVLKAITLTSFLVCSGSEEFVAWLKGSQHLLHHLSTYRSSDTKDENMAYQIRTLAEKLSALLRDPNLLEQRKEDINLFRTSLSTPGRNSSDIHHINTIGIVHIRSPKLSSRSSFNSPTSPKSSINSSNSSLNEGLLQDISTFPSKTLKSAARKGPGYRYSMDMNCRNQLCPVTEEEVS